MTKQKIVQASILPRLATATARVERRARRGFAKEFAWLVRVESECDKILEALERRKDTAILRGKQRALFTLLLSRTQLLCSLMFVRFVFVHGLECLNLSF